MLSEVEAFSAQTQVYSAPRDLEGAVFERVRAPELSRGIVELAPSAASGTLTLPALPAPAFDALVASWNADVPPGTAVEAEARLHAFNEWSPWFSFGRWGPEGGTSVERESDTAWMDIDTLKLKAADQKADAFQLRARLFRAGRSSGPTLSLLAASVADHTGRLLPELAFAGAAARELEVPARSQMTEQAQFARDICSPTSLAMAMDFWGAGPPTAQAAAAVQDRRTRKYGDWPFNTAWAARAGLRAHVSFLNRMADLEAEIADGRPVVVSISFKDHELAGSPLRGTRGHLLVVRGFTPEGDVVVNDPAAPDAGSARRVYRRPEFRRAWLENKRGLAYLLRPRWPADLALGTVHADLMETPQASTDALTRARLSQLLQGEPARVFEVRGTWARVEAVEQPHLDGGVWSGYRGWLPAAALATPSPAFQPNAVVASTRAVVTWEVPGSSAAAVAAPLGARLMVLARTGAPLAGEARGRAAARLFSGLQVSVSTADLQRLPLPDTAARREAAVAAARRLLGRAYLWGGRSQGLDCSGLTGLALRAAGLDVPRDAHDQFLKAAQQEVPGRAGDLLFLSRPGQPHRINHVALLAGGETLIEAVEEAGVRETTFSARFKRPRAELRAGDAVDGRSVWFGTFLTDK